jgi:hypothetical protein
MSPELAAVQGGYFIQALGYHQRSAWGKRALRPQLVEACLTRLNDVVLTLSDRLNDYQSSMLRDLMTRIPERHDVAEEFVAQLFVDTIQEGGDLKLFRQRLDTSGDINVFREWQRQDWQQLHDLFEVLMKPEAPWFLIGDRLGDTIYALIAGTVQAPLSPPAWDDLYRGVQMLPPRLQSQVAVHFPRRIGIASPVRLGCQLRSSYGGLCEALKTPETFFAVPHWDQVTLSFRGRTCSPRHQSNSVIIPILDEFERQKWRDTIDLPSSVKGDAKQAIYNFNQSWVIQLHMIGHHRISWTAPPPKPQ